MCCHAKNDIFAAGARLDQPRSQTSAKRVCKGGTKRENGRRGGKPIRTSWQLAAHEYQSYLLDLILMIRLCAFVLGRVQAL